MNLLKVPFKGLTFIIYLVLNSFFILNPINLLAGAIPGYQGTGEKKPLSAEKQKGNKVPFSHKCNIKGTAIYIGTDSNVYYYSGSPSSGKKISKSIDPSRCEFDLKNDIGNMYCVEKHTQYILEGGAYGRLVRVGECNKL